MFGSSNPFGQSSSSPFGSPSVFGQTGSTASNPFAPKPFGSPNPFASQAGSSVFGTSTGVFGQPSTPAFGVSSTPAFGASSTPAFGSSMPAFGASSTPAFGSSSSSFGGSSLFGQKPAFGGFGSTSGQTTPFGSTFQQTQPAFGSTLFGSSSPFSASSQPAFGATTTPAFGTASSPGFGATSTPAFGASSTPAFGVSSTPAFGAASTPAFGSTSTPAFGSTSTPLFGSGMAFGASSTPAFGAPSTSLFGSSSTPAFGGSSTPAFGSSSSPAFGVSSTSSFSFGSAPSFGQSTPSFGSSPFGSTPSPFSPQSSPFGTQTQAPTFMGSGFGQSAFGGQAVGSRVAPYTATPETDASGTQPTGKLESISAMPIYKDKSHEELRWEDYQRGDKGGPNPAGQPGGINFPTSTQANPFGQTGAFGQTNAFGQPAANPFSSNSSSNPFAPKTPAFGSTGFGSSSSSIFSSPFSSTSSSPFGAASSTPSLFGAPSVSGFGSSTSPSIFGSGSTPAFGSSPSIFGSSMMGGSTSSFGSGLTFGNTQSSGLFSSTPSIGQTPSPFGQSTGFGQSTPAFGSSLFNTPSTGFGGGLFSNSTPSLSNPVGFGQLTPSLSTPFQQSSPAQTTSTFSFGNFGQPQAGSSGGFGSFPSNFNQSNFGQSIPIQSNVVMQPTSLANPFGTLPVMPQMSIGRTGSSTPSVQYGISNMPVSEKPSPVRISSLVAPRHISQRRIRLPARRYHPKSDSERVPFFSDNDVAPSTPKADALFIPRENPRSLIIRPVEQWPSRNGAAKQSELKISSVSARDNGNISEVPTAPIFDESLENDHHEVPTENGHAEEQTPPKSAPQQPNGFDNNHTDRDKESHSWISGRRASDAAISYEHGAGIGALMPKLNHSDYYTEPCIAELAAKERAEPGYCKRVKDFVIGRRGYGSIKLFGETDVRGIDLESIVQFNNREVVVYPDDSKKPPVGEGLNKAAEVSLLNIKCMNKKAGQEYTEGPKVERYREILMKKAQEQGAESVSFDPAKREWKFRVKHFSSYRLDDSSFCQSL